MIRLFLSHSSEDAEVAALIVQLFASSIGLRSHEIRCTSIDGYCLPGGANFDEQLRDEVLAAECFIGLLSNQSLSSAYVLFELGARWGARKQLIPVLAPGVPPDALKGPLKGLNALSCSKVSQLQQLVHQISQALNAQLEPSPVYQWLIEKIVSYEKPQASHGRAKQTAAAHSQADDKSGQSKTAQKEDYNEADTVIALHCEREWPDDYSMRAYCTQQQSIAVATLRRGRPVDIPENVFRQIRNKCAREWPDDYSMRVYTEEQQLSAYRALHSDTGI